MATAPAAVSRDLVASGDYQRECARQAADGIRQSKKIFCTPFRERYIALEVHREFLNLGRRYNG